MHSLVDPEALDWSRYPYVAADDTTRAWVAAQALLGLSAKTIDAYARGLDDLLTFCRRHDIDPLAADRGDIARYVGDLRQRPSARPRRTADASPSPAVGLSNATIQQRLTAARLFFDYLIEEGSRADNPVGRGRYTPGRAFGGHERALVPRWQELPWLPNDEQWHAFLAVARQAPIRTRCMVALAYDAGLRREELCSLRSDDLDPAYRLVRVRAEAAKGSRPRTVPYSAATGALLRAYLLHRRALSAARGPLFLSESPRNYGQPLTLWTWSKVVRALALAADLPRFSTHTFRHLCLTDLARSGWEVHQIAQFAGHRNPQTTLLYIHLSGHDLAAQLARGMSHIHAWRVQTLASISLDAGDADGR